MAEENLGDTFAKSPPGPSPNRSTALKFELGFAQGRAGAEEKQMCGRRDDGNVFLVGQTQALGPGSPGTCPEPCFLKQGASALPSGSPRLDVLSVRQRVGGHLPS